MGKTNPYSVTLYPAKRDRGFITTSFTFGKEYPTKRFEANSVDEMLLTVAAFASEHGKPCYASVRCDAARNPPGFKKATESLYFNLDKLPEPDAA